MRKLTIPCVVAFAVVATVGCSFKVGSGSDPNTPATQPGQAGAAPGTPAPAATTGTQPGNSKVLGRTRVPGGAPPAPGTAPSTPPPAGMPVLVGTNVFGSGTPDAAGWKGSFFVLSPATQKLPALATMTPNGVLFAKELNVPSKAMTGGFPGIDATRNEDFAIRWEAPLIVDTEADYTFRLVSDDGAVLNIDGTLIVDNDGQHTSKEKSGPVHLVKGTHVINVDYFQATGPVNLQLFCKKAGGTETVCPTRLP